MSKVQAIWAIEIPSESKPGEKYRVQFVGDGARQPWYCECRSWRFNIEHRGDDVPRECKHTRQAAEKMRREGKKAFREVRPLGPWFEQLQEYVVSLVDYTKNGGLEAERLAKFRMDLDTFREERDKIKDSLASTDTLLQIYGDLLRQLSERV